MQTKKSSVFGKIVDIIDNFLVGMDDILYPLSGNVVTMVSLILALIALVIVIFGVILVGGFVP